MEIAEEINSRKRKSNGDVECENTENVLTVSNGTISLRETEEEPPSKIVKLESITDVDGNNQENCNLKLDNINDNEKEVLTCRQELVEDKVENSNCLESKTENKPHHTDPVIDSCSEQNNEIQDVNTVQVTLGAENDGNKCNEASEIREFNEVNEDMTTKLNVNCITAEKCKGDSTDTSDVFDKSNDKDIAQTSQSLELQSQNKIFQDDVSSVSVQKLAEDNKLVQVSLTKATDAVDIYDETNDNSGIKSNCSSLTDQNVLITVNFKSHEAAELFKDKILKALGDINDISIIDKVHIDNSLILIRNSKETETLDDKLKKKKQRHDKKRKDDLFIVDTKPSGRHDNLASLQYSSKFTLAKAESSEQLSNNFASKTAGISCFNCSESHSIRDCPHPKDFVRINKAKAKQHKVTRYHNDEDQKFSDLKPGKLTCKLKDALGLKRNELPLFIYRMRDMGYPPGWVEEAFDTDSNLALFDSDGNALANAAKKETKINPEKIIEYPGFNAPMDKNLKDEYKMYGTSKYSKHINKQSIIETIQKLKDNHESCDMDIDEDENEEKMIPPGCEDNRGSRNSPTLNDLEEEKLKLLAELNQGETSTSNDNESKEPKGGVKEKKEAATVKENKEAATVKEKKETATVKEKKETATVKEKKETATAKENSNETNSNSNSASVKMSSFGTPILDRKYQYTKLPNPDNFSLNISPVINFENLPNSTNKYEQMVGVLQKVRKTLKNSDNSKL